MLAALLAVSSRSLSGSSCGAGRTGTAVHDAFTAVSWPWVAVAIGLNLLSIVARSSSWDTCIKQSLEPPRPTYPLVFSAFCVGLFANAVLPGRVGELARAAVLAPAHTRSARARPRR